jgi:hypothetical protein
MARNVFQGFIADFPSDVLDLSVRFGENGLLPKDIMRAIQQERT